MTTQHPDRKKIPGVHSISSIQTYMECPRRYDYAYVRKYKDPRPVPIPWRIGSSTHAGLEAGYNVLRGAQDQHLYPYPEQLLVHAVRAAMDKTTETWREKDLPEGGGELDRALEQVGDHMRHHVIPHTRILGVEHKMFGPLPDGVRTIGYADLVLEIDPETLNVVDHKHTRKRRSRDEIRHDPQLGLYAHHILREFNRHGRYRRILGTIHFIPLGELVTVEISDHAIAEACDRISAGDEMIHTDGRFEPSPGEHCTWCPFQPICPAHGGEDRPPRTSRQGGQPALPSL